MPHTPKCFIDIFHDLRGRFGPAKFEKLLPDMTGITVNNCLRNATKEFVDHDGLVIFWNRIKCFLNDVASECIHREIQGISTDGLSNLDDLLGSTMLEATLDEEVAKAIDHQRIGLCHNSFNNVIFLLGCTYLELLLEENRCLLVVITDDFVNNILPVAVYCTVKETTIIKWFRSGQVRLTLRCNRLENLAIWRYPVI